MRTEGDFAKALEKARKLANMHNKSFWIVPTKDSYEVSCFDDRRNLPAHTNTLEISPENMEK